MGLIGLPGLELVKLVVVSWTRRGLCSRLLLLLGDKVST